MKCTVLLLDLDLILEEEIMGDTGRAIDVNNPC